MLDFPDEILLEFMGFMSVEDLLIMTKVCKRFCILAKTVFNNKFNGINKYFTITISPFNVSAEKTHYEEYFTTFGKNISCIEIKFFNNEPNINVTNNHWIVGQIKTFCPSLKCIRIYEGCIDLTQFLHNAPGLRHIHLYNIKLLNQSWATYTYHELITFCAYCVFWRQGELETFINNNNQLETLKITTNKEPFQMFFISSLEGQLLKLKHLHLSTNDERMITVNNIEMLHLESIKLKMNAQSCINILMAITPYHNITKIVLNCLNWNDKIVEILYEQYRNLKYINIKTDKLTFDHINQIIGYFPKLIDFNCNRIVTDYININRDILRTIFVCKKLENLSIGIPNELLDFCHSIIYEMAEATRRNLNLKISLYAEYGNSKLTSHQGTVRRNNAILYWDGYDQIYTNQKKFMDLNEKCIQKIIYFLNLIDMNALFNTCKRTQKAVKDYLSMNAVHSSIVSVHFQKNVFICLGKYIKYIDFSGIAEYVGYDNVVKIWTNLNRYCINLTELIMDDINNYSLSEFNYPWYNLAKIKIFSIHNEIGYKNLYMFECPKLLYLEINRFHLYVQPEYNLQQNDCFRCLSVLKVSE